MASWRMEGPGDLSHLLLSASQSLKPLDRAAGRQIALEDIDEVGFRKVSDRHSSDATDWARRTKGAYRPYPQRLAEIGGDLGREGAPTTVTMLRPRARIRFLVHRFNTCLPAFGQGGVMVRRVNDRQLSGSRIESGHSRF